MTYKVDQVLYVLHTESMRVVPIQVVEEAVRRTRDGEMVTYQIVIPSQLEEPVPLENVKGKIFKSLGEAKKSMRENALAVIDSIIETAEKEAKLVFDVDALTSDLLGRAPVHVPGGSEIDNDAVDNTKVTITLPDGTEAKVNMPESIDEALSPMQN